MMTRLVRQTVPCLALLAATYAAAQRAPGAGVAITHATVIDVATGARLRDRTVIIGGNRITRMGPSADTRVPAGARVLDARGKFLIPGLWDMHAHVVDPDMPGPPELTLPLFVATGVTGIRDMGSSSLDTILRLRGEVRTGARVGPRMVVAGKIIDGPPLVFPPDELLASTPEEGRRAVDSLADRGADFIKAYEMLRRDVFLAVLDEARRRGLPVAGHVPLTVDAAEASDSGMRSFEHLRNIDLGCSASADSLRAARTAMLEANAGYAGAASAGTAAWSAGYGAGEKVRRDIHVAQRPRALDTEDAARCAALLARLARNGTWQTATLYIQSDALDAERQARLQPTLRYVPRAYRERWERGAAGFAALPAAQLAKIRRWASWEAALVRRLADARVPLLAGTDVSVASVVPGFGLHEELDALVRLGHLTPFEALRAATLEPARYFGAADSSGTVAAGKVADLVLLDADPLLDIRNTQRIRAVVADGRLLDRAALDALLAGVERAANPGTPGSAPAPDRALVLRHATLLDGLDTVPKRDVAITIRAGRIASVRPDRDIVSSGAPAGGARDSVIDLHGAWVTPGLIDAHAHVGLDPDASMDDDVRAARQALEGGATTLRSAGVDDHQDVALRDRFRAGAEPLPRVLPAGRALSPLLSEHSLAVYPMLRPLLAPATAADSALRLAPGPAWRLTGNAAAIDTAVGALAARGAEWVKVFATGRAGLGSSSPLTPLLTERDMRAVVRAAARRGMLVEAHAHGDAGIRNAVRAGVRTIEHGTYASDTTLRLMRARGTCFTPTLSFWDGLAASPDSLLRARAASMRTSAEDAVRRARALGVAVIAGTDNAYAPGSRGIADEVVDLTHAGLSPNEALFAATSRSARCLAQGDRLGAVAPGRAADLLVLDGDPRADLRRLGAPRLVIVAGRIALDRR